MDSFLERLKLEVNETRNARVKLQNDSKLLKSEYKTLRQYVKTSMMMKPKPVTETFSTKDKFSKTI